MPKRPALPCGQWFCPVPLRLMWPDKAIRLAAIGAVYGRSRPETERRARLIGIWDARPHGRTPVYSAAEFKRLWLDPRVTRAAIGARYGMSKGQVWKHAQALGLPPRKSGRLPTYSFGVEFDAMWRCHVLAREMARHYGCAVGLIGREAQRRGLPKRIRKTGHLSDAMTLAQFREWQLGQALAREAAATAAALRRSDMVDALPRMMRRAT